MHEYLASNSKLVKLISRFLVSSIRNDRKQISLAKVLLSLFSTIHVVVLTVFTRAKIVFLGKGSMRHLY